MNTTEKEILKQFEQEHIIQNLARYELRYQIALEFLVQQTEFDEESAYKKLDLMHLEIEPENVFYTVVAIIRGEKEFVISQQEFEKKLEQHAYINALEDYLRSDTQLIHPEMFLEQTIETINENHFFTQKMQNIFNEEYENVILRWKLIITKELAKKIQETALSMF